MPYDTIYPLREPMACVFFEVGCLGKCTTKADVACDYCYETHANILRENIAKAGRNHNLLPILEAMAKEYLKDPRRVDPCVSRYSCYKDEPWLKVLVQARIDRNIEEERPQSDHRFVWCWNVTSKELLCDKCISARPRDWDDTFRPSLFNWVHGLRDFDPFATDVIASWVKELPLHRSE